jgi:hypothetical protein
MKLNNMKTPKLNEVFGQVDPVQRFSEIVKENPKDTFKAALDRTIIARKKYIIFVKSLGMRLSYSSKKTFQDPRESIRWWVEFLMEFFSTKDSMLKAKLEQILPEFVPGKSRLGPFENPGAFLKALKQ